MKDVFPFYSIGNFINQPNNKTEFELLRFETMAEPDIDDYHKHTFYEILWTEQGISKQIIDYYEYKVAPNSLFFISPNQVHHFEEWKPLKGGTILFSEDFYLLNRNDKNTLFELSFLDNLYANPCVTFSKQEFKEILRIILEMETEKNRQDKKTTIIQAYLHILLSHVQRHVESRTKQNNRKYLILFKEFKQELEKYFIENKTTSYYAEKLHITPHHLNVVCKEVTNKTATNIIRERSILEAKRLLTFSNKTISEIAVELNYTDSSYFTKTFKAITKLKPQYFKNQMSEKYRTR